MRNEPQIVKDLREEERQSRLYCNTKKLKQLEKFKKVTVGRELKMIELKKKISEVNKEHKIETKNEHKMVEK